MPTENEIKFVIHKDCESNVQTLATDQYEISQGYLIATRGITVRIRKSIKKNSEKPANYYFTLKTNTAGRVIEIENNIDQRDFTDLWNIALNKLEKIRYIVKHKNIWELDFFKDYRNKTYMAIAEVELPENQTAPNSIPDIVKKNLIYQVPLTDTRFSNKLLGDARYAVELLNEIKNEIRNNKQ